MSTKRESYIEKSIAMLIKTGDFENIRIGAKIGETIDWSSPKERAKKVDAIREDLKRQIAKDVHDILESFELDDTSVKRALGSDEEPEADEDEDFEL